MSMPAPSGPSTSASERKTQRWPWILGIVVSLFVGIGIGRVASTPSETMETCTEGSPVATLPPAEGASLDNPIPVGDAVCVGRWRIQVTGYTPDATDEIREWNPYLKKREIPSVGEQYVLVTLKMKYEAGLGCGDPYFAQRWAAVSSDGTLYQETTSRVGSPDGLGDSGCIPAGLSAGGTVNFLVKSDDVQGLRLHVEASTIKFEGGGYITPPLPDFDKEGAFFALEEE